LASIVFGVLALSWRDVTVFVVAILFGARTALFGLSQLFSVIARWRRPAVATEAGAAPEAAAPAPGGWLRRSLRLAARVGALVLALILLAISATLHSGAPARVPSFYDWTSAVPTTPGELLRVEPMTNFGVDGAQGWLILYTTKTSLGEPAVGSAFVIAPKELPSGPRPVILWTHGTVGIARECAPSLFSDITLGVPAVPDIMDRGWVMVAPDYVGMGTKGTTPYLIGTGEAYSALDAVRAAHHLSELSLSNQTVVWGHSQGGHAALWTGRLAASYAPDLKIVGVAALAPATDLLPLAKQVQFSAAGTIASAYLITSYSNTYSNVRFNDYVRAGAYVQVTHAAKRCLTDPSLAASLIAGSGGQSIARQDFSSGSLAARLSENTPTANLGGIPLLVAQGTGDEVINISITQNWVAAQCAAGYHLAFKPYPDLTHMGLLGDSMFTTDLVDWTVDRFSGAPAPATC
jgi:acetyl esterase/lipase